jgi:NTP pyrophosphatase (non-canonical NTP hydrolase)
MAMDTPARGIVTGTPVPNVEREAAAERPAGMVTYKMDPEEMEAYLKERYGDRLGAAARYAAENKPFKDWRRRREDKDMAMAAEDLREKYLELRASGKPRYEALRTLKIGPVRGTELLKEWGLEDKATENAEVQRMRAELGTAAEETATTADTAGPEEESAEPSATVAAAEQENGTEEAVPEPVANTPEPPVISVPVPIDQSVIRGVLDAIIRDVHDTARSKGWYDTPVPLPVHLALIHSEVSEALQADRKGEGAEHVAEELADVMIRVMDTAAAHGLDLAGALLTKMERNKARPYRHGGRRY